MSRHKSNSKKPPPEIGLHMECEEEDLEPSQVAYYNKAEKEYNEVQAKVDSYIKKMKAEVVERGENCLVLQLNANLTGMTSPAQVSTSPSGKSARHTAQASSYQQLPGQGIITRSNANSGTNTYLVMDSRLGFMVGQVQSPNAPAEQVNASTPPKTVSVGRTRQQTSTGTVMVTTRAKSGLKKHGSTPSETESIGLSVTRTRQQEKVKNQAQQLSPQVAAQQQQVFSIGGNGTSCSGSYKIRVNAKPTNIQSTKPNESNAIGGLSAGSKVFKGAAEDLASGKSTADSREVAFSRLTGKIFPSLVVVARPHLKLKYINQSTIQQERSALDAKVKGVLMYTSTKFIEWLIQQGLIRSEQICQTHVNNDLTPVKLKLGMYSDVSKFPYSGGYVWISDCCPQQFVSVFSGSIFEGAPHPPTTLLKLIYHWACQTNVQNVVQWVKVDNLYLKNFYTNMRAVCTQAIHEKFKKLGGPRKKIEVGVISLGTTSQDGNKRQVKVEVLGVMDQENKAIRLRAVEPLSVSAINNTKTMKKNGVDLREEERSFKRRFVKILEPLEDWVHKESIILTDFTVAKTALNAMGFNSVYQVTNDSKLLNQNVMEYLRRIVPRMFQNTLSLLSRQIIQQFLDELVWREIWGPIPSQAFATIITHLGEQTKLDVTENFLVRLNKVAANPFKIWNYSAWKQMISGTSRSSLKTQQKTAGVAQESLPEVTVETSDTPSSGKGVRTRKRAAEQPLSDFVTPPASAKKVAKVSAKDKQKKEDKVIKKEQNDKLSDEIIKFINEGKQIPLENYYYGSRNAEVDISHSVTGPFNVKCCVCNKKFTDNITIMKHMILHCQTDPVLMIDVKKVHQCGYCFLGFNTNPALKAHLQQVHSEVDGKIDSNLLCNICEEKFSDRVDLIYHMHRTHVELEMPYECGACRFRTSVYKVFVDHFIQAHQNEEHVFCPYCLKLVTFSYKGEPITTNVHFYMSHLEKHQRMTLVKDCTRCQLSFIHKGILDQHMEADHVSWKNENGITRIEKMPGGILMPEPGGPIKPSPVVKLFKCPKVKNMFTMNKFKSLEVYGLDETMACVECEGSLTFSEHFTGSFNCLKCRYASCCEKAMLEHFSIFHENLHPQFTKGKPIILAEEMFCSCGFSTPSGNRMARHLALCERESAYPSKEAASAALQLRELADLEENPKQGEGQNVLNMLGLIRKSPEVTCVCGGEGMKIEVEREERDLEIANEMKPEVMEISSKEDNDASSNLQQEESVIVNKEEGSKSPQIQTSEGKTLTQDSVNKSKSETIDVDCAELVIDKSESVEELMEIIDEKEKETSSVSKELLQNNEKEEKEKEVGKKNGAAQENQSKEQCKGSSEAGDEKMDMRKIKSAEQCDDKAELDGGNLNKKNEEEYDEAALEKIEDVEDFETVNVEKSEKFVDRADPGLNVNIVGHSESSLGKITKVEEVVVAENTDLKT